MKLAVRTSPQNEHVDAELRDLSLKGVGFISSRLMAPGASITIPFGTYITPNRVAGFAAVR